MSEKFIIRLKKSLLLPILTILVVLSQIAPTIVSAETTVTNVELVDEFLKELGIEKNDKSSSKSKTNINRLTDDATENMPRIINEKIYKMGVPAVYAKGQIYGGYHLISPYAFNIENKSIHGGYSRDGRLYTTGTREWLQKPEDMKWYPTTKYLSEQHPELKYDLDDYFGEENLFRIPSIVQNVDGGFVVGETMGAGTPLKYGKSNLSSAIYYKDSVYKALKSKNQQAELTKIAVKNGLIDDKNHKVAPYLALFTYYGILNRGDGFLDFNKSSKAYLTREQADLMLGRFMHSETYFEAGKNIKKYPHDYTRHMMISDSGDKPITAKELSSNITKLEFIYMITECYFKDKVNECSDAFVVEKNGELYMEDNTFWSAKVFNDIDKKDWIKADWIKSKGLYGKGQNEIGRAILKYKKLDSDLDNYIQAAYKLGILKKDSEGNANLFKNISYSDAITILINTGLAKADQQP